MWQSSFQRLMQFYTVVLCVMVIGVTIIGSVISVNSYQAQLKQAQEYAQQRLTSTLTRYQELTTDFATTIASDQSNLTNIDQYFNASVPDYAEYVLDQYEKSGRYYNWPSEVNSFMAQHSEVAKLELALPDENTHFVATNMDRSGQLLKRREINQHAFRASIVDYVAPTESAGTLGLTFSNRDLVAQLKQIGLKAHMQILVINDRDALIGRYADASVKPQEKQVVTKAYRAGTLGDLPIAYRTKETNLSNGYRMVTVVNWYGQQNLLFWRVVPVALIGLGVLVLLSLTLWITFRRYRQQLAVIVETVQTVGGGDLSARIPDHGRHTDLTTVAQGINTMLSDLNDYINAIYKLQMAQQQANMKALQAQINPHFMSNTLEYIRMAALDADQPELAKVIFSFAALLRNNTDQSTEASLTQELAFLDKYIYLYQVRFPEHLAYQVQVDPDLEGLIVPKFSLQPLVENYFKHGVDFARIDNAISIKANRTAGGVRILIKDNGRSLSNEALAHLNLQMMQPLGAKQSESIGLQNVYARMANYFGDSFKMRLQRNDVGGTSIMITFKEP